MFVVVSYDIIDDRVRQRVANILEDYGVRVQYSVFEVEIDEKHFGIMKERIFKEIDKTSDKIHFYFLCNDCKKKIEYVGERETQDEEVYII
ncbi:MAG: CRISPR-associated endonuclease Cas2 [Candidatus Omnitrophica bacterium 4484_70.1]|nr:MAG: CRISPR-associated endonuclease Cas2 [Candidatus Omnitrophica bacterium 4484_70.1]